MGSYDLFWADYIESPEILESLARDVEQLMKYPIQYAEKLIQDRELLYFNDTRQVSEEECIPSGKFTLYVQPSTREGVGEVKRTPFNQNEQEILTLPLLKADQGIHGYNEMQNIDLAVSKELADMAFKNPDCNHEDLEPLERSLVKDLRDIARKHNVEEGLPDILRSPDCWNFAYQKILLSTEQNTRRRILDGIQFVVEGMKHFSKEDFEPVDN